MSPESTAKQVSKEEHSLEALLCMVRDERFELGGRLPTERALSEQLGASRNTIRGALRVLEAKGLVEVRPGSGCYLRSRHETQGELDPEAVDWSSRLEACYLIFPRIAALCTERISASGIAAMELRLMDLSRALFARNPDALREHLNGFARDIAGGTGNPALRAVVEALCPGNSPLFGIIFYLQDYEREMLFGDTAKIVQAMKRRDADEAARCMEERILRLAALLERHADVPLSPLLKSEGERLEVFG
ncbi:GntR family transcriptional regulator [Desulfovibrio aminophilus]|uniref:FadR/GntR family transcriptional regulator n=1 Tax=Desulfovibrio aminophilus TaxID=81425 RepID=UPI0033962ACA